MGGHTNGLGSRRAVGEGRALEAGPVVGCPGCQSPAAALARVPAGVDVPGLAQSRLLWGHLLWGKTFFWQQQRSEKSEVSVQTGCIPEASLKA